MDRLHRDLIDSALTNGNEEREVKITFGELMLFHCLMQDYGLELVGSERFIPLMQRNKDRIDDAFG